MKITFSNHAWTEIWAWTMNSPGEVGWYGEVEIRGKNENIEFYIPRVLLHKQVVTGGSFKISADDHAEFLEKYALAGGDPANLLHSGHSHYKGTPFQSCIDHSYAEQDFQEKRCLVAVTTAQSGELYGEVMTWKPWFQRIEKVPVEVEVAEMPEVYAAAVLELKEKVKEQGFSRYFHGEEWPKRWWDDSDLKVARKEDPIVRRDDLVVQGTDLARRLDGPIIPRFGGESKKAFKRRQKFQLREMSRKPLSVDQPPAPVRLDDDHRTLRQAAEDTIAEYDCEEACIEGVTYWAYHGKLYQQVEVGRHDTQLVEVKDLHLLRKVAIEFLAQDTILRDRRPIS